MISIIVIITLASGSVHTAKFRDKTFTDREQCTSFLSTDEFKDSFVLLAEHTAKSFHEPFQFKIFCTPMKDKGDDI